jgi:hypothetical protein
MLMTGQGGPQLPGNAYALWVCNEELLKIFEWVEDMSGALLYEDEFKNGLQYALKTEG